VENWLQNFHKGKGKENKVVGKGNSWQTHQVLLNYAGALASSSPNRIGECTIESLHLTRNKVEWMRAIKAVGGVYGSIGLE
jgi:hypothetical protein